MPVSLEMRTANCRRGVRSPETYRDTADGEMPSKSAKSVFETPVISKNSARLLALRLAFLGMAPRVRRGCTGCQVFCDAMPQKTSYRDDVPQPAQTVRLRLRELIDAKDVTKSDVARAIGQHPSFISKVLSGEREANDLDDLVRIARFFGVSVGWLIGETPRGQDSTIEAIVLAAQDLSVEHQQIVLAVAQSLPPATPPVTGGVPPSGLPKTPRSPR